LEEESLEQEKIEAERKKKRDGWGRVSNIEQTPFVK
jgi:hypothetical protein